MEDLAARIPDIFGQWGYDLKRFRPDLNIAGSPARSLRRDVLEDVSGQIFVIEQLPPHKKQLRLRQSAALRSIAPALQNLRITLWLKTRSGEDGYTDEQGFFWQLRKWLPGLPLDREKYADDAWRGKCAGEAAAAISACAPLWEGAPFLLGRYIQDLLPHFQQRMPALVKDIQPIIEELRPFTDEKEPAIPAAFCHGDYHPGNILWGENSIQGIIDWEFMGMKYPAYDLANMLGCLGMDLPENLYGPMAMEMVRTLRQKECFTAAVWECLPEAVAALRFAWLREWVALKDIPMLCQELNFIWLVLDNRDRLRSKWGLSR
ncbi:MAG: aminoglycoside phosphotransferase family protein [Victivallales bacterium]|nr:aminoglycoside phosphotransferase family protein [Victivallales bacterium]